MRRLTHLVLAPTSRLVRLMLGEKRITCDLAPADNALAHLPVFHDLDGTVVTGLWAIIDHLENEHPERPLLPADAAERGECLRLFDWTMNNFHEETTKRIVFEKGSQGQTGSINRRPPNMETVRLGRQALKERLPGIGVLAETRGFLAGREVSLADLAMAGASFRAGLFRRNSVDGASAGHGMVQPHESRAPRSARCSPTGCRASRRCRIMRSSISEAALNTSAMRDAIRARALAEGFDAVGFARAAAPEGAAEGLGSFLARDYHGDMAWMQTTHERRADPEALWPDAKTVITLGVNYAPATDPFEILARREHGCDFRLRARRRLSRRDQAAFEAARGMDRGGVRRRREGVRRHSAGDGEAAIGGGRHRLAGQTHQSGVARVRLVAVSGFGLHHAGVAGG
jgi:glutathione S-transferase